MTEQKVDTVPVVEPTPHRDLLFDDPSGTFSQVRKADMQIVDGESVKGVVLDFSQLKDRITKRLARNRAPVGASPADDRMPFDGGNGASFFNSLHGGSLAAGAGSNDEDVVFT